MSRTRIVFAAAALALCAQRLPAEFQWRKVENRAFRVGETIVYELKYGVISAGKSSLTVKSIEDVGGRPAYHIISHAKTNRTLDKAFKVRDSNDSWMDVESLCSLQFMQDIREGSYRKWTLTKFDQPAHKFVYEKKGKKSDDHMSGDAPHYVQDVLSALYFIRTMDLKPGGEYTLEANSAGSNWPLKVVVKGVENADVPVGTFECFRIEPILAGEGIFQNKGKLEVWMTRDKRKIPVRLRSEVSVGAFEASMKEYSARPVADGDDEP